MRFFSVGRAVYVSRPVFIYRIIFRLGGGEIDLKLGFSVAELLQKINSPRVFVADVRTFHFVESYSGRAYLPMNVVHELQVTMPGYDVNIPLESAGE